MSMFEDLLAMLGLASLDTTSITYVPVVTVKVVDSLALGLAQGETLTPGQLATKAGASPSDPVVANITSAYAGATFTRMLEPHTPAEIDTFVTSARSNDPTYEPPNIHNFLEIVCPLGFDTAPLVVALTAWTGVVEYAYRNNDPADPVVTGTTNPLYTKQGYLSPAPTGIDAQAAWSKGADGTGTFFVDVEQGWFLTHSDLPPSIHIQVGSNQPASFSHGVAVLGEIVALDNNQGVVGIAPGAGLRVVSYADPASPSDHDHFVARVAARVFDASMTLVKGDVVLLEIQDPVQLAGKETRLPVENQPAVFHMIRLAVANGVIVVEAAGNNLALGGFNLDTYTDANGRHVFDRTSSQFKDSGAIMVGACDSGSKVRSLFSNYGSRIDCFAWGDSIVTCGFDPARPAKTDVYWGVGGQDSFGGTSGASPIIVGCCLLIQQLQTLLTPKTNSGVLGPAEMRRILSESLNATDVMSPFARLGGMPDLAKIIANEYL